jgi:hypothetical protein
VEGKSLRKGCSGDKNLTKDYLLSKIKMASRERIPDAHTNNILSYLTYVVKKKRKQGGIK